MRRILLSDGPPNGLAIDALRLRDFEDRLFAGRLLPPKSEFLNFDCDNEIALGIFDLRPAPLRRVEELPRSFNRIFGLNNSLAEALEQVLQPPIDDRGSRLARRRADRRRPGGQEAFLIGDSRQRRGVRYKSPPHKLPGVESVKRANSATSPFVVLAVTKQRVTE